VNRIGWKITADGIPIQLILLVIREVFLCSIVYFLNIDDEEANDYQPSSVPKTREHERFIKDKEDFKQKYKQQIDQV
jgi:hypothetical protein